MHDSHNDCRDRWETVYCVSCSYGSVYWKQSQNSEWLNTKKDRSTFYWMIRRYSSWRLGFTDRGVGLRVVGLRVVVKLAWISVSLLVLADATRRYHSRFLSENSLANHPKLFPSTRIPRVSLLLQQWINPGVQRNTMLHRFQLDLHLRKDNKL